MSSKTDYLKLYKVDTKTDGEETFNIDIILNDNWDKIDSNNKEANNKILELQNKIKNVNVPVTSVNAKTGDIVLNAEDIKNKNGITLEKTIEDLKNGKLKIPKKVVNGNLAMFDSLKQVIDSGIDPSNLLKGTSDVFITGTYEGNGSSYQNISLDFTPKVVIVTVLGMFPGQQNNAQYSALAVTGQDAGSWGGELLCKIISGGFRVYNDNYRAFTNRSGFKYTYLVLK